MAKKSTKTKAGILASQGLSAAKMEKQFKRRKREERVDGGEEAQMAQGTHNAQNAGKKQDKRTAGAGETGTSQSGGERNSFIR